MPVQALSKACVDSEEEIEKQKLLEKIERTVKTQHDICNEADFDNEFLTLEEDYKHERELALQEFQRLSGITREVRLDKLILIPDGCSIFEELCLRVDVNQKYASILPQWKDIADVLQVDHLRTLWVETCVRPKEGLTRAMLEIYMRDGGTLGEVLEALIHLELFDVLGTLKPKLLAFCENHVKDGRLIGLPGKEFADDSFFSVLSTLAEAFKGGDPCKDIQRYSGGLKSFCRGDAIETVGSVQSGPSDIGICQSAPKYKSNLGMNERKTRMPTKGLMSCKIFLLFSEDGIAASNMAVEIADQISYENYRIDLFRLNENSLWYEVLTNPEGCCMKWVSECDYLMPILSPKFLQEIHGNANEESDDGFIPTAPALNRYIYTLARAQYTQAGCKNYKVRPIIPMEFLREIRGSNAVRMDPLFNHVWIPMTSEKMNGRLKALLQEFIKKNRSL